jgi:hypothetical protein
MEITLTTPSLLFPAISLLMLAYTNRFLALAGVMRSLDASYRSQRDHKHLAEIAKLNWRIRRIRDMQFFGVLSLLLCTTCMFLLFQGLETAGKWVFGLSLMAMITSLVISLIEIQRSVDALDIHLGDLERVEKVDGGT